MVEYAVYSGIRSITIAQVARGSLARVRPIILHERFQILETPPSLP